MESVTSLEIVAENVYPNEPALLLAELNRPAENFKGFRRWQMIKVVRNDRVVTYKEDLGPAENFIGGQVHIPGGMVEDDGRILIWHSVAELQGMAEELRQRDSEKLAEEQGYEMTTGTPAEWQEEYLKEADRRKMAASKKSVNGTHFSITR